MKDCPTCFSPIDGGRCTNAFCGFEVPLKMPDRVARRRDAARQRAAAAVAKKEAMARVDGGADELWKALADAAIVDVARAQAVLTADDVWKILDARSTPRPRESRALGPRMMRAARMKIIEREAFKQSERASRHAAPIQTWRSLVFRG